MKKIPQKSKDSKVSKKLQKPAQKPPKKVALKMSKKIQTLLANAKKRLNVPATIMEYVVAPPSPVLGKKNSLPDPPTIRSSHRIQSKNSEDHKTTEVPNITVVREEEQDIADLGISSKSTTMNDGQPGPSDVLTVSDKQPQNDQRNKPMAAKPKIKKALQNSKNQVLNSKSFQKTIIKTEVLEFKKENVKSKFKESIVCDRKIENLLNARFASTVDPVIGDYKKLVVDGTKDSKWFRKEKSSQSFPVKKVLNQYYTKFGSDAVFKLLDDWEPTAISYDSQVRMK